jgi:lipopolysaccharide/colanic/teichoic acid biosynthesis glycosyltransferase
VTAPTRHRPTAPDRAESGLRTQTGYRGKRLLDVVLSVTALVLAAPLLAVVWVLVRWTLGPPAVFRQQRPGLHGAPFEILKFRTMTDDRADDGSLLPDGDRITRLGAFLRKTSIDEVPELWNVLRGEMSLVGPRPLLTEYLPHYSPRERRRHEVRPGITGLAQVSGRNLIGWAGRLECDAQYVERMSLGLDVRILARTVAVVISRDGVSVDTDEVETRLDEERMAMPPSAHECRGSESGSRRRTDTTRGRSK